MDTLPIPEECSDAIHAELHLTGAGDPFLVLITQEELNCTVVRLAPLLRYAAAEPRLRILLENALNGEVPVQ